MYVHFNTKTYRETGFQVYVHQTYIRKKKRFRGKGSKKGRRARLLFLLSPSGIHMILKGDNWKTKR